MGASLEGICHEDRLILDGVLNGMPCVGDGYGDKEAVQDSHLFQPQGKNAQYSLAELRAGKAKPRVFVWKDGVRTEKPAKDVKALPSSTQWLHDVERDVVKEADKAMDGAGVDRAAVRMAAAAQASGDASAVPALLASIADVQARKRLQRLLECEKLSLEESRAAAGKPATMTPVKSIKEYRKWAAKHGGVGAMRVSRRHVIQRGLKKNGEDKLRCIDNLRDSGLNGAITHHEKADLPSFLWMVWMACVLARAWFRVHGYIPPITGGLDDQWKAYRSVLCRLHQFNQVAYFCFRLMCLVIHWAYGLLFGNSAANICYSRVPRAACTASTHYFLCPTKDYVDDLMNCDVAYGGLTVQAGLRRILTSWGWDVELTKRNENADHNIALGGLVDFREVQTRGVAIAAPDPDKVKATLSQLKDMEENTKTCMPAEAETIVGRGRWITQQHEMHVGAAALQPFAQRARGLDASTEWTTEMTYAREFLEFAFDPEFEPRIEVPVLEPRDEDEPIVCLFTDAAEEDKEDECGFFVYDTKDDSMHASYDGVIPEDYKQAFWEERKTHIGIAEESAGVGALYTIPQVFKDRRVIHFVDNSGSLSHLVNGYANQPDSARVVNLFHAAIIALKMQWWGEWVPSKANIADIMTRLERLTELREGLGEERYARIQWHKFELPPLQHGVPDLRSWARDVRRRATERETAAHTG